MRSIFPVILVSACIIGAAVIAYIMPRLSPNDLKTLGVLFASAIVTGLVFLVMKGKG